MVNVTIINVVPVFPVLTEVFTGHSLDSTQMTILMDVEQISSTTFTTPLFWFLLTMMVRQCSECQSGEVSDWRNREHVVLDLFSNVENGKDLVLLLVNFSSK